MTDKKDNVLQKALWKMLLPLVRVLLRQGVAFDTLSEILRRLYVEVAEKEFSLPGKKQTVSRISTITGLSRKEVTRLKQEAEIDLDELNMQYNRAARVITGWVRDADFHDARGQPAALTLEEGQQSFAELVKRFSGDIPPRAIADELIRTGAIEMTSNGLIQLKQHAFVPDRDELEKLKILGTDVSGLIATIDHNIHDPQPAYFQRKVFYTAIPESMLPELRTVLADQAQSCLEQMDRTMAKHDSDANPELGEPGNKKAGVGIYYFEENGE
ncbi:MAG: DUF6502 family protein [Gammaproteobacteria bacterium]|nr:DUF6502 family protein [Gammaproteobacteria bacterium]MDH5650742.1 DUF6502 family protein [Gammaproteobacteria bacterium]